MIRRGCFRPLDGRLSPAKWDSRVVGNLLCCWRGDSDTRPKGNLFARETRAIDCNCVFGSVMAIGYGQRRVAGWLVDKFLIMGLLFSRFEGFVGFEIRVNIGDRAIWLLATCLFSTLEEKLVLGYYRNITFHYVTVAYYVEGIGVIFDSFFFFLSFGK